MSCKIKPISYMIVRIEKVPEYLADGWELWGFPFGNGREYYIYQCVIKGG